MSFRNRFFSIYIIRTHMHTGQRGLSGTDDAFSPRTHPVVVCLLACARFSDVSFIPYRVYSFSEACCSWLWSYFLDCCMLFARSHVRVRLFRGVHPGCSLLCGLALFQGPAFKDDQGELMANVQGTMKRRAECIKARWLLPFFCAPCQFSAPCSVAPFAELCSVGTCPLVISWPM